MGNAMRNVNKWSAVKSMTMEKSWVMMMDRTDKEPSIFNCS